VTGFCNGHIHTSFHSWGFFCLKPSERVSFPLFYRSEGSGSADAKVAAQVAREESELCSTSMSSRVLLGDHFTSLLLCLSHSFNDFVISSLLSFGLNCCHLGFRVGLCVLDEISGLGESSHPLSILARWNLGRTRNNRE